eukprot:gene7137-14518_t
MEFQVKIKYSSWGSNPRPSACKADVITTKLEKLMSTKKRKQINSLCFKDLIAFQCHQYSAVSGSTRKPMKISKSAYFPRSQPVGHVRNLFPDPTIIPQFQQSVLANTAIFAVLSTVEQKSLTPTGLLHAFALGIGLWTFIGIKGWAVCVAYLIVGSFVTKIKMKEKEAKGIAEARGGARGPENVWGSAATAMICAILTYAMPEYTNIFLVGYISSLATKLSDTVASEIGKAYGKTTYLITTMKIVPRGTEGAVSLEGTLAGVVGSLLVALLGFALGLINSKAILISMIAAFIATTFESYIGATYQDSIPWLTNELVNLINTIIGAL